MKIQRRQRQCTIALYFLFKYTTLRKMTQVFLSSTLATVGEGKGRVKKKDIVKVCWELHRLSRKSRSICTRTGMLFSCYVWSMKFAASPPYTPFWHMVFAESVHEEWMHQKSMTFCFWSLWHPQHRMIHLCYHVSRESKFADTLAAISQHALMHAKITKLGLMKRHILPSVAFS